MPWNPEHYKQIGMTTLDIKNLTTKEMVELIGKLEKEIAFREEVGKEIERRNYPEGSFEHMVNLEHLKGGQ